MGTFLKTVCFMISLLSSSVVSAVELTAWPPQAAEKLNKMIEANAHKGEFAVFDMDNTSYQYDLMEALLPFLEQKGVLTRDTLDPSLKLIPFKDLSGQPESLYSYYYRLCEVDDLICYPWLSQAFSGLTLQTLKGYVDEMIANSRPVPVRYFVDDNVISKEIYPPRLFRGMIELYNKLQENGIQVYVMTAAHEELVRMVASNPKYGYNVKPENVIGVNTLLKNKTNGELTTSRLQIRKGSYNPQNNMVLEVTPYLVNPMTWQEGKAGSILGWIDQWRKPVLVAGDTPRSDGYMLLNSPDLSKGALRLWVNKKERDMAAMREFWQKSAKEQQALGLPVTADKNWVIVRPEEIH